MIIQRIDNSDDLVEVCVQLAHDKWGKDNDMAAYEPEELSKFVCDKRNLLVVGYVDEQIVCSALAYTLDHPDIARRSLYIDELDTHPEHRRKGFASDMIDWFRNFALENKLTEVWLTTEAEDNDGTNSFYKSLKPDESLPCNLYSYKAKSN